MFNDSVSFTGVRVWCVIAPSKMQNRRNFWRCGDDLPDGGIPGHISWMHEKVLGVVRSVNGVLWFYPYGPLPASTTMTKKRKPPKTGDPFQKFVQTAVDHWMKAKVGDRERLDGLAASILKGVNFYFARRSECPNDKIPPTLDSGSDITEGG